MPDPLGPAFRVFENNQKLIRQGLVAVAPAPAARFRPAVVRVRVTRVAIGVVRSVSVGVRVVVIGRAIVVIAREAEVPRRVRRIDVELARSFARIGVDLSEGAAGDDGFGQLVCAELVVGVHDFDRTSVELRAHHHRFRQSLRELNLLSGDRGFVVELVGFCCQAHRSCDGSRDQKKFAHEIPPFFGVIANSWLRLATKGGAGAQGIFDAIPLTFRSQLAFLAAEWSDMDTKGESEKGLDVVRPNLEPGTFFVICPPGLEAVVAAEIRDWLPEVQPALDRGGVTISLPLETGFYLNRILKTPTRILLRLSDFGCRDFPKLFKKAAGFPWENWVSDQTRIDFHASTTNSRLRIKKRIEETCDDGRKKRLKQRGAPPISESAPVIMVQVRFKDDVCFLSLDTSGELLHKRGLRTHSSEAPLRENLAAALLYQLENFKPGDQREVELVDLMTGGGTFLLEAALRVEVIRERGFPFESFLINDLAAPTLQPPQRVPITSLVGFDIDDKALASARVNLSRLPKTDLREPAVDLIGGDVFAVEPLPGEKRRWAIANPPYGERIAILGSFTDYYSDLFAAAERVARPERACFLLPEKAAKSRLRLPAGWRLAHRQRFLNGGLPVEALYFVSEGR